MKKAILTVVLTLVSAATWGDWAVRGEGNFSCPEYVSAKRGNEAKLYSSVSWVQGFITGVNQQRALPENTDSYLGQDMPAASIARWLENYCHENIQNDLADAAEALVKELVESKP